MTQTNEVNSILKYHLKTMCNKTFFELIYFLICMVSLLPVMIKFYAENKYQKETFCNIFVFSTVNLMMLIVNCVFYFITEHGISIYNKKYHKKENLGEPCFLSLFINVIMFVIFTFITFSEQSLSFSICFCIFAFISLCSIYRSIETLEYIDYYADDINDGITDEKDYV